MTKKPSEIRAMLQARSFLGVLPDAAIDLLIQRGRTAALRKGQAIYERGDDGDSLMFILSGRVKIYNVTGDGREVVLNFLGPGDVNGELAVLDGRARSASAVALEAADVLVVYRRDLIPLLKANPDSALGIIDVLCGKVRAMSSMIEHNALDMSGRMAGALLRLAEQHGQQGKDGTVIDLKLSQRDIGAYAALSRENANRQLNELANAGFIRLDGATITIVDIEALQDVAQALGD